MSVTSATVTVARGAGDFGDWLIARPRTVLGALVGTQVLATLALALSATHNGWVYYQGGDQIGLTTAGWLVGGLELPPTTSPYLWPFTLAPITWVTGPTFVEVLPPLVVLQVLLLAPAALLCVYGIATAVGGRLLGYWASLLWIVAPFAAIPLFVDRYQERWTDQFLPQALGLTAMSDFPSMVLLLASALFLVRSLAPHRIADAALAGALAGAAGGVKPPNYLFLAGAALAYVIGRRWREGMAFAALVVPSVLVLALWKYRGLGALPVIAADHARVAAGAGVAVLDLNFDRYLDLSLDHWKQQMNELREFFWSARLAQWAPFAGLLAVLRVQRGAIAGLLAGWLAAFLVVKGFSPRASIETNTFWRLLMPAWPAYLLLFASIPLLVPTLARRLGERLRAPTTASAVRPRWVIATAVLSTLVPACAIAASARLAPPDPPAIVQGFETGTILTPVDGGIDVVLEPFQDGTRLSWTDGTSWNADVFYRVYRTSGAGSDLQCVTEGSVAWNCYLTGQPLGTTRDREWVDASPVPGATYRVGIGTNWVDDPEQGDVFVFSPPLVAGE